MLMLERVVSLLPTGLLGNFPSLMNHDFQTLPIDAASLL
jgi:hypothetical protein